MEIEERLKLASIAKETAPKISSKQWKKLASLEWVSYPDSLEAKVHLLFQRLEKGDSVKELIGK